MNEAAVIVVGGGLAGFTAAIHLARRNIDVILFEKEDFPHHKVCGEYVSREIVPYLDELGAPLQELNPPQISRLLYSTATGSKIEAALPLGGIGISRYNFDYLLFQRAVNAGVRVVKESVASIESGDLMQVETVTGKTYTAKVVLGCYGKRSGLDKKLKRSFFSKDAPWLAVKSHYNYDDFPRDLVALHNFNGGYCGLSKTELGTVNVCYLATYKSFKNWKDPESFKENVLRKNPLLDDFFRSAIPVFEQPLTIAQVSFHQKSTVHDHVLMAGDAAGLLHPLCGNGMAMAIHSAKIASETIEKHLNKFSFNRDQMENEYSWLWKKQFKSRIRTGKYLQKILLNPQLAEMSQSIVSKVPFVLPQIIKRTHGKQVL